MFRRGGRLSLFEPINRFGMAERRCTWGYDVEGAGDLLAKVGAVYDAIQPETDPMVDFDERDLLTLAANAGFFPVSWTTEPGSSRRSPEAMAESLTDAERDRLEAALRTAVEEGRGEWRMGEAYLWAVKQ